MDEVENDPDLDLANCDPAELAAFNLRRAAQTIDFLLGVARQRDLGRITLGETEARETVRAMRRGADLLWPKDAGESQA